MTGRPKHEKPSADRSTVSERRDGVIRDALEHDQDQAEGNNRQRAPRCPRCPGPGGVDIQRRAAHEAQERIDVQADIQRRDARDQLRTGSRQPKTVNAATLRTGSTPGAMSSAARHIERNVTDQQRAGDLEQANQALDAFAFSVSHDLRAPLRAMDGYTAALLEDYGRFSARRAGDTPRRSRPPARR